jgi:SMODS and SLOG-associating 2TM effector domain 2
MTNSNGNNGNGGNGEQQSGFFKQDLGRSPLLKTKWDKDSSAASLDAVYAHVMNQASQSIDWYLKAKRVKRICARGIRIYAILGGAAAAALPTIADMDLGLLSWAGLSKINIKPGGASAIILGTIAALLLLDRFFGFSSGWVRFCRTQLHLRQIAQEFQLDWEAERAALRGDPPEPQQVSKMLARCKAFAIQVNSIVREETDIWIQEFQETLRMLDDSSKPKAVGSEPGALNLTVAGGDQSQVLKNGKSVQGWMLSVDDSPAESHEGSQAALGSLLPGRRVIKIWGNIGEQTVKDERVINVPAGGICTETLKLS